MSFPLKAYVVSRNEINSFKLSGFVLLFTSLKTEQRILLNLCSIGVLLKMLKKFFIRNLFVSTNKPNCSFIYFLQCFSRTLIAEMPGLGTVIEMWYNKWHLNILSYIERKYISHAL